MTPAAVLVSVLSRVVWSQPLPRSCVFGLGLELSEIETKAKTSLPVNAKNVKCLDIINAQHE